MLRSLRIQVEKKSNDEANSSAFKKNFFLFAFCRSSKEIQPMNVTISITIEFCIAKRVFCSDSEGVMMGELRGWGDMNDV